MIKMLRISSMGVDFSFMVILSVAMPLYLGDRKALVESEDWEGPAYQTCNMVVIVCRKFESIRRRINITFNHHREIASLPPNAEDRVLDWLESQD